MYWSIASLIALTIGVFLLAFVYFYFFLHYKERYILVWSISWLLYALSHVFAFWFAAKIKSNLVIIFVSYRYNLFLLNLVFILFSGLFLLWGTYQFINIKMSRIWVYTAILGTIWIFWAVSHSITIRITTLPIYTLIGLIYIWAGRVIISFQKLEGAGKNITGVSFILWGIYKLMLPILADESWLTPWGFLISGLAPWGFLINMIMTFAAAVGILLLFFNRKSIELVKSEERFRLMAENAQDILYRICKIPRYKIEYVSPACTAMIGFSPEEIYDSQLSIIKRVQKEDRKLLKKILQTSQTNTEVLRWKHKDGFTLWIEHSNVPVFDNEGNFMAVEGIARNITVRKKGEEALQRYKLLSKWARDIILMILPDGKIIEANNSAAKTYGYSRTELMNLNVRDLFVPEMVEDFDIYVTKKASSGVIFESVHCRKNGKRFPVEISLQGTMIGNQYGLLSIVRDITLRKEEEIAMVEAREKVAKAERMISLGMMAAGVAHEINQPLNSLKVRADSMLYLYKKQKITDIKKIIENIKVISDQATRIDSIIRHMRCFIKKDSSDNLKSCSLNAAVENALALIAAQLISHSVDVKKDLVDNLPSIEANNIHLEEIVINLVVNAMQALKKIERQDKLIICKTYYDSNYIILEISDNGPGISEDLSNKIFDPFFSKERFEENMGLGLSIVQSIVGLYNGDVSFRNNNDAGTTFIIKIPYC